MCSPSWKGCEVVAGSFGGAAISSATRVVLSFMAWLAVARMTGFGTTDGFASRAVVVVVVLRFNSSLQCSPWSQDRLQLWSGKLPQEEKQMKPEDNTRND